MLTSVPGKCLISHQLPEKRSVSFLIPSPILPRLLPCFSVLGGTRCCDCEEGMQQVQGQTCSPSPPVRVPGSRELPASPSVLTWLPVRSQQEGWCSWEVDGVRRLTHSRAEGVFWCSVAACCHHSAGTRVGGWTAGSTAVSQSGS